MYRYDLHCHTIEGSKCSRMSAAEMVQYYIDQGYAGFCVTDHFTGSTTVPDDAPWEERIDRYYDGYEAACKAAEGKNITVFFGVEHSLAKYGTKQMSQAAGNDFLIFGLSREWLKANEAVFNLPGDQLLDAVHAAGGM